MSMVFLGNDAVLGTQQAEVFSVRIKPKNGGDRCEIYGTVRVKDELGYLDFYDRVLENAELINYNDSLSLISPDFPISAGASFTVELDLKDKNGGIEFIKGSFTWDPETTTWYDKCISVDVKGNLGLATVYCTVITVAATAVIEVKLNEGGDGSSENNVFGTLNARYGKNYDYSDTHLVDNSRIVLLEKTFNESEPLVNGVSIHLLRPVVTVPCYSSLIIEADLWHIDSNGHKEQFVSGELVFRGNLDHDKTIDKQDGHISINVVWLHAFDFEEIPSSEMKISGTYSFLPPVPFAMEVFSFRVIINQANGNRCDNEVYGALHVEDSDGYMVLYENDKNNPQAVNPDDTLSLTGPVRSIMKQYLGFTFSLKERQNDIEVCNGFLGLPDGPWKFLDKRVCAVIEGEYGYGVLHFTAFSHAVQATVKVTLLNSTTGECASIHGSLIASYDNYDYSSDYSKKYFRTRLFDVFKDKPEKLKLDGKGVTIPLSRYAVAVPTNSSLVIDVNLTYSTKIAISNTSSVQFVKGSATFFPQPCGTVSARIGKDNGVIEVEVTWIRDPCQAPGCQKPSDGWDTSQKIFSNKKIKVDQLLWKEAGKN